MKRNNNKGFTLAELLIVVAIIAVLVAVAIPTFSNQLEKARQATDVSNLRSAYAAANLAILTQGDRATEEDHLFHGRSDSADAQIVYWYNGTSLVETTSGTPASAENTTMGKATTRKVINQNAAPGGVTYSDATLTSDSTAGTMAKGVVVSIYYDYANNAYSLMDVTFSKNATYSAGRIVAQTLNYKPTYGTAVGDGYTFDDKNITGGRKPYVYSVADDDENWQVITDDTSDTTVYLLKHKTITEYTEALSATVTVTDAAGTAKEFTFKVNVEVPTALTVSFKEDKSFTNAYGTDSFSEWSGNVLDILDVKFGEKVLAADDVDVTAITTLTNTQAAVSTTGALSGTPTANGTDDTTIVFTGKAGNAWAGKTGSIDVTFTASGKP